MSTKEKAAIEVSGADLKVTNIDLADLPGIIAVQVDQISALSVKVSQAIASATQAKQSAESAKNMSAGFGHKKAAIESLQGATTDLAKAQISMAGAQKLSFQYQEQLGEITKYLFKLGVTNIAATRTVIRELELRLQNASKEELDALAKEEICGVIAQLKAQEDIMNQQKALSKETQQLSKDVSAIHKKDLEQDQQLLEQAEKAEELDQLLSENATRDEQQDRLIEEGVQKDEEQDLLIEEQAKKDEEHDRLIAEQAKKDEEHDRLLEESLQNDAVHDQMLTQQAETLQQHDEKIKTLEVEINTLKAELARKSEKTFAYISAGVAALAVLLSVLQYLL